MQPLPTKNTEITNKQQSKQQKTKTRQAISVSENQNGGLEESVQDDVKAGMKEKPKNLGSCHLLAGPGGQGNVSQNITRKIDPLSTSCLAK